MSLNYDVAIIGGGPGGYVAGIRAGQLGLKAVVIERDALGGICLNWGCMPTKSLLKSAEIYNTMLHSAEFGITTKNIDVHFDKIIQRSREISSKLSNGISHLLKKNKVDVIKGYGKISGKTIVSVESDGTVTNVNAKHIIIATGARARILPNLTPDGKHIWSYREALTPTAIPKSMLIIGSGAIGIEFASFYNTFGTKITLLESHDRILKAEDHEIAEMARKAFVKQGIDIKTDAEFQSYKIENNMVKASFNVNGKTETVIVEKILSAVGVVPNIENIGLENTKVQVDRGCIKTDKYMATAQEGVYAIGDVTSPPWLAHKASHEAIICVEKIAGLKVHSMDVNNIPGCTYSYPQIASVGLTEEEAIAQKKKINIGKFPFVGSGKALVMGETEGLVKTIFDKDTGELIGAHLIGADVTEMIQGFVIGKSMEATEQDLINAILPHPTLSEMLHESALSALGRSIHI
jgi:dihydrolipoamide dehydrogenase